MPSTAEPADGATGGAPGRAGAVAELATATMFLTRLPVGGLGSGDPAVLSRATRWFPLVGLVVGALVWAVYAGAALLWPPDVAAVLALAVSIRLTGAFHEDGLADVADSAGAFGIDAKLEIMRDSRVGTYGALALVLLVLAKYRLLVALGPALAALALPAAHVASRWAAVWLMARFEYARPEAANRVVAEGVDGRRLGETTGIALGCLAVAGVAWVALAPHGVGVAAVSLGATLVLAPAVAELAGRRFRRALGGVTGDCLGAANQAVEVATLAAFAALLPVLLAPATLVPAP